VNNQRMRRVHKLPVWGVNLHMGRGSYPLLVLSGDLSWYEMTLMDAQEKEAPRSTLRESRPSMKFPNFVALICSIIDYVTSSIQGETDQQGWRDASE
jgi:hypothetical protein